MFWADLTVKIDLNVELGRGRVQSFQLASVAVI